MDAAQQKRQGETAQAAGSTDNSRDHTDFTRKTLRDQLEDGTIAETQHRHDGDAKYDCPDQWGRGGQVEHQETDAGVKNREQANAADAIGDVSANWPKQ